MLLIILCKCCKYCPTESDKKEKKAIVEEKKEEIEKKGCCSCFKGKKEKPEFVEVSDNATPV